jgi:hypothetical protein
MLTKEDLHQMHGRETLGLQQVGMHDRMNSDLLEIWNKLQEH